MSNISTRYIRKPAEQTANRMILNKRASMIVTAGQRPVSRLGFYLCLTYVVLAAVTAGYLSTVL